MLSTAPALRRPVEAFYADERAALAAAGVTAGRAALAAARAAALFARGEGLADLTPMQADAPPTLERLLQVAAALGVAATPADAGSVRAAWHNLGTTEALMETGGDIRLATDPRSALNGYGCSHRPRPWAVTFASSTASSSSERGYAAAAAARRRVTARLLAEDGGAGAGRAAIAAELETIRASLAARYGLANGAVALAASGTDTELLALALTHLARPAAPILNILIAPEETGAGVPMAARGLHFAIDTALGHDVSRAAPIEGFRPDTGLATIALRDRDGEARPAAKVAAEVEDTVATALTAGRRPILHVLDLSKTGLLAPGLDQLRALRARHGAAFDIVVDACQGRLSPASVADYLGLDAVLLLTGSKFFTGPPFAGALLMPEAIVRRLDDRRLPAGLEAYFGRDELPAHCPAAAGLPAVGNYGLALRWHAALAEIAAFFAVPPARREEILAGFGAVVAEQVAANPALRLLPAPPLRRGHEDWERRPSIFSFSMAAPHDPGRCLDPDEARAVYRWLNADLADALPGLPPAEIRLARRICHIGQPVKLPCPAGFLGVLRVSGGARLISGEPSHGGLGDHRRVDREYADLRDVFGKIGLILRHYPALAAADPQPRYRRAEAAAW